MKKSASFISTKTGWTESAHLRRKSKKIKNSRRIEHYCDFFSADYFIFNRKFLFDTVSKYTYRIYCWTDFKNFAKYFYYDEYFADFYFNRNEYLSLQFAIAPISDNGGMIAIMSLLLTQLGFSPESVGIIAATDIFLVNLSGVITLIVRDCDLYDLSKAVKLVN